MTGEDDDLDPDAWAEVASYVERHGFLSWLGVVVEDVERGRVRFSMPYDEKLTNPSPGSEGTIHGGVAATLVDTASGFALRTTFQDPAAARLTTTDLDVKYLRPARDDLVVEADVVRAGDSVGVTDVTVTSHAPDGERKAVAVGSTSYRLFRGEGS
jgi:uncharacterized protein (TIGR00369 family)